MTIGRSAHLSIAALALVLAACASPPQASAPDAEPLRPDRVVVAPLNLAVRVPAELAGDGALAWAELLQHFLDRGQQVAVLSPESAEALWNAATSDLDSSDRSQALRTARSRLAQLLADYRDYDVLVVPSLVLRPARVQGAFASWDGVRRIVPNASDVIDPGIADIMTPPGSVWVNGLSGTIAAASLHVAVLGPDGTTLYEGLGGLDLAREPRRETRKGWASWTFETRRDPLADPEHLREGIDIAVGGGRPGELRSAATARAR